MVRILSLLGVGIVASAVVSAGAGPADFDGRLLTVEEQRSYFGGAPQLGGSSPGWERGTVSKCVTISADCDEFDGDEGGCTGHEEIDGHLGPTLDCVSLNEDNTCATSGGGTCAWVYYCQYLSALETCIINGSVSVTGYSVCNDVPF